MIIRAGKGWYSMCRIGGSRRLPFGWAWKRKMMWFVGHWLGVRPAVGFRRGRRPAPNEALGPGAFDDLDEAMLNYIVENQ